MTRPVATEAKKLEIVSKRDFKTLFEYAVTSRDGAWKDTAYAIWTMYMTGMRVSECLSLTFEDFDGKYIHIRRQYIRGKWQTPKTKNSIRKIAVDEKTKSFIYELKKYYSSFDEFEETWFIFGGYRHMDPEILRCRKNKLCAEAGVPEFNIHALRHSHASNLIEAGVNMYKISKRLGHSSIRTTMDIYGHLIDTEEDEVLNVISNF
ncbi:site-specific integrase [Holdemanella porci]|uniref:site-specific integrase n=1 Tax=Holdemanella porci TaxID=2652276 RepID=UPI003FD81C2C